MFSVYVADKFRYLNRLSYATKVEAWRLGEVIETVREEGAKYSEVDDYVRHMCRERGYGAALIVYGRYERAEDAIVFFDYRDDVIRRISARPTAQG